MVNWFKSNCDEIVRLNKEVRELRESLEIKRQELQIAYDQVKAHNDFAEAQKAWAERMQDALMRAQNKCEVYDQVMKGLQININLSRKK